MTAVPRQKKSEFDPTTFLAIIGETGRQLSFSKARVIFSQGDAADEIFYIKEGSVRLGVVSNSGKEAIIALLSEGQFFGEGALAGQRLRIGHAIAMTDCEVLQISKHQMLDALHRDNTFSHMFVTYLLARNIRYEEDLVDQLFNSTEKRLARILLLLAQFGNEKAPETAIHPLSQETLAEMVGTTRPRINLFMNKFRRLGFIDYGPDGLQIHRSLLQVVLHD
jgi:CRP/FNR family transcriptional regulator, cyclic AMP receptor protein